MHPVGGADNPRVAGAVLPDRPATLPAILPFLRRWTPAPPRWAGAPRHWLATLKSRIVLLAVLTGLLSAAGTTTVVLRSAEQSIRRLVLTTASGDREDTAQLLGSKVAVLRGLLTAVAAQVPSSAWHDAAAMGRLLQERPALGAVFRAVYVAGLDGRTLARVEAGRLDLDGPDIADRDYFRQALATGQPVISDVLWGRVVKSPVVVIATPVFDAGKRPVGVLAGSIALTSTALFERIGSQAPLTATQDMVIDRAGQVLAHPDPRRVMSRADAEPALRAVLQALPAAGVAAGGAAGGAARLRGLAVVQGDMVVSMAGIPDTDWTNVHLAPLEVAMAPVADARRAALPAALGAGLAAGLVAGVLGWWATRPISRLRARAESLLVDEGQTPLPWPEDRGEVGDLAHAFRSVVEQRARRQTEVQALLQQLEAVLDHADVGIALTRSGRFELVSRQFCHIFRCDKNTAVGQSTRMIYPDDAAYDALVASARAALSDPGVIDTELQLMRHSGQVFWARMRGRAVVPGDVTQGTIWTIEDVTAAREQREKLAWRASHDALTGLLNRAAFERLLEAAVQGVGQQPFCALFIDLDRFKQVNDSAGHAAGDALLRDIAQLLAAELRKTDVVARLGGDEFAVLLPACPPAQAQTLADALCSAVQQHTLRWEGQDFSVGASVGLVAVVDGRFASAADVLRAADMACYQAKKRGRSRVEQFQPSEFQLVESA
jgi:diguanylate cyclase (GGDEF)-like protein/PAS domain S-box-containing protein